MRYGLTLSFIFFAALLVTDANARAISTLYVQPRVGYQLPQIFQDSQSSTYKGLSYSGSIYYKFPVSSGASLSGGTAPIFLAPTVSFLYGSYDNNANNSVQTETLTEKTISAGMKIYFNHFFIEGHYSWISIQDVASGQTRLNIEDRTTGLGAAIGLTLPFSHAIQLEISAEVDSSNFSPSGSGGFSTETHLLRYGGFLGLSIAIPSSSSKK